MCCCCRPASSAYDLLTHTSRSDDVPHLASAAASPTLQQPPPRWRESVALDAH
ncbi:hypothetical protein K525DRAFT_254250 [Schizophyllum commune Loenen D]|nr:hypothetical protein K525DRAFT_254250 [Schizophyllum commune Loenen D]